MIEFEDVEFGYEDGPAVFADLSFSVEEGETVALLGPNGTGKTTLLKLVAGLLEPTAGTVDVGETDDPAVGLAPENPDDGLFTGSVREEVAFFPRNRGLAVEAQVESALDSLGISDLAERVPQTLSEGEKRLVLLASVLAGDPDVIGLDEPTSGLDTPARDRLGETLAALDRTVLVATHDTDFAWTYADTAIIIEGGSIHRGGPIRSVLGDPELDVESLGLRRPGPVRWAAAHDFDRAPDSIAEAAAWLGGSD